MGKTTSTSPAGAEEEEDEGARGWQRFDGRKSERSTGGIWNWQRRILVPNWVPLNLIPQ